MKLIMVDQEPAGMKTKFKQPVTVWRRIVVAQSMKSPKVEINIGSIHTIICDELDFIKKVTALWVHRIWNGTGLEGIFSLAA